MLIKIGKSRSRSRQQSNIIVRNYEHYNKSFKNWNTPYGRYIGSKSDYENALIEEGMVTEKEADKLGLNKLPEHKDYAVTNDTLALINSVAQTKDKQGRVKPSDRAIDRLIEKKQQNLNYNKSMCPEHYKPEGGFE